jgi:hypothetical protein
MELVLIGSSPTLYNWISEAEEFFDKKKGFTLWWSYPIRNEFLSILNQKGNEKIKVYIYYKGDIKYLFLCDDFVTKPGNIGIQSPWPEYTSLYEIGRTRAGPKNSEIFKTWFLSTDMQELSPIEHLNDFKEYPTGKQLFPFMMKNAFVYAYKINPDKRDETEKLNRALSFDEKNDSEMSLTDFTIFPFDVDEGKRILKQHYERERNQRLIDEAKKRKKDNLKCEVCGFSFSRQYGDRGKEYIEGHHLKPLASRSSSEKTRVEDIALVCSNCHRMIHRRMDDLSIKDLKNLIRYEFNLD